MVQALLSSQLSAPDWCWQPVAGTQMSVVQTLLSLHAVGTLIGVCEQPLAAEQASMVQALLSSQLTGVVVQPDAGLQLSFVHEAAVVAVTGVKTHWPVAGLQASVVQALLSLHCVVPVFWH
jgi:hypothetical protein